MYVYKRESAFISEAENQDEDAARRRNDAAQGLRNSIFCAEIKVYRVPLSGVGCTQVTPF